MRTIQERHPETGEWVTYSWDQVVALEKQIERGKVRLTCEQMHELERIKKKFHNSPDMKYQRDERQKQSSRINRGIDRVSKGAKTFKKGWDRRVVEGGRGRPKMGYWRGGTYYPYQKSYRKKQKSRSKPMYDSSGRQFVVVNGKAYPVANTQGRNGNTRYSNKRYRKKKYYKKKKDEPEINGFFNIFG